MTRPLVFIVDDNTITRRSIAAILGNDFESLHAESGEDCLALLQRSAPDLILLDIEMNGIDGFETCRRLRQQTDAPVIFVSSHDTLEERILGFDCGGDDFIVKPYDPIVLARKASRLIERQLALRQLDAAKTSLEQRAELYARDISDTGLLLQFMRESIACRDYDVLAQRLLAATVAYGVNCHVQLRFPEGPLTLTSQGAASPLEASILERSLAMGRIFRFSRRLVINYDQISLLVLDLPQDADAALNIQHNLCVLAESAEAIAETIAIRKESASRAEALQIGSFGTSTAITELRALYRQQQVDARITLDRLIDAVEKTYVYLGLSTPQEDTLSQTLRDGAEVVLRQLDRSTEMEARFQQLLDSMQDRPSSASSEVWL